MFSFSTRAAVSWHYELESTAKNPSTFEALQVEQTFREQNFLPLNNQPGFIPALHVDQIFSGPHDRTVFYKEGFRPSDRNVFGQIVPIKNGFLFHRLSPMGRTQAFFFYQWKQSDVTEFLQSAKWISTKTSSTKLWMQMLLPEAQAESASVCLAASRGLRSQLEQTQAVVDTEQVGHIMKTCAVSALKGAANGVEDMATGAWYLVKNLFTNPEQLWNDAAEKFSQIKDLVMNLQPRLQEFFQTITSMDADTKAEIACSTIASLVVQSLIPGAAAKGLVAITEKISTLTKITKVLELMSRLKNLNPKFGPITHEVLACAM